MGGSQAAKVFGSNSRIYSQKQRKEIWVDAIINPLDLENGYLQE